MLLAPVPSWGKRYSNFDTASTTPGTSVTPGVSNAEGSWTQVVAAANVDFNVYEIHLHISNGGSSAAIRDHLLDIGIDPAGGSSYTEIISNISCGASDSTTPFFGIRYKFPFFIPAGSTIAARIQCGQATAGTPRVGVEIVGAPSRPEAVRAAQYSEVLGTITNSRGTLVTSGTSGTEGSWVSLGTTTRDLWWWQVCCGWQASSTNAANHFVDLAVGDATNKKLIIQNSIWSTTTAEMVQHPTADTMAYCEVPAGSEIWVRSTAAQASASLGMHALAIGLGG